MIEIMQKRINEIKQQDRKSYYEIANEIGISESTLYKLMSKGELFTPAEQKITAYLKGYLTKDEKLEAYRLDNEELKAENDRLKSEFKIESLTDKTTKETIYRSNLVNKYRIILQEIKVLAEKTGCRAFIDLITKAEEE
jgi:transcriptional regulator with XRE-family HTH domain